MTGNFGTRRETAIRSRNGHLISGEKKELKDGDNTSTRYLAENRQ